MPDFSPTQGRYLAFVHAYTGLHGCPPSEAEIAAAMCVSPPSVNQMVKQLERKGLISRQPGLPRTLQVLVPEEQIPQWNNRKSAQGPKRRAKSSGGPPALHTSIPANLYVLSMYLMSGPVSKKFASKVVSRVIEIRGDQTLEDLHQAIFLAYDRWEHHMYEFQLGKRPYDPDGPNYGVPDPSSGKKGRADARTTRLDDLHLKPGRAFGYWFDFGDDWYHQVAVERIEQAIPTVIYPRVVRRIGKSPPQYSEEA